MQAHHYKLAGLLVLSVVAITVAFLLPPIAQDPAYQVFFIGILLTGFLSGHSIKHIIAAGGALFIYLALRNRHTVINKSL